MAGDVTNPVPQKPSVLALIGGGLGAAVGIGVGRYAGFALLFPAGFALLVGWLLSKAVPSGNKAMVPASAVQAGHGLWMLLGMVILSRFDLTLIDFAILVPGAAWLAFRPSIVAVGMLVCYQLAGIALNGFALAEATRNTDIHKALLVHLVLRVVAIALMVYGLIEISKQKKTVAGLVLPGQADGSIPDAGKSAELRAAPDRGRIGDRLT